jgi:hypothetical protein
MPVMQCRSSGIAPGDYRISYVANAGPLNLLEEDISGEPVLREYGRNALIPVGLDPIDPTDLERPSVKSGGAVIPRDEKEAKMYTIFFDHLSYVGPWTDTNLVVDPDLDTGTPLCKTRITMDNISSMDGTSLTILITENENAGNWIWEREDRTLILSPQYPLQRGRPIASLHLGVTDFGGPVGGNDDNSWLGLPDIETLVAFCYPSFLKDAVGEKPDYVTRNFTDDDPDVQFRVRNSQPWFINEGRANSGTPARAQAVARPSSGHPGVVVAAFCDRHVQVLRDDMDKTIFVQLSRPGSGVILNPKDLE